MLKKVKEFFKNSGLTSLVLLVIAIVVAILGFWFAFWFFLGGFVINNWNAIVVLYKKYAKAKVDATVKQIEDKAKAKVDEVVKKVK